MANDNSVVTPEIDVLVGLEEYSRDFASYASYPQLLAGQNAELTSQLDRLSARKGEMETLVQLIDAENSRAVDVLLPQLIDRHASKLQKAFDVVDAIDSLVSQLCRAAIALDKEIAQAESQHREKEWSESLRKYVKHSSDYYKRMFGGITTEFGDLDEQHEDAAAARPAHRPSVSDSLAPMIPNTHAFFENLRSSSSSDQAASSI